MERLLRIEPGAFVFPIRVGEQSSVQCTFTNVHHGPISYKVRTSHPLTYCVQLNKDILAAGESKSVLVLQKAKDALPADLSACRERLQIIVAALDTPELRALDVEGVWQALSLGDDNVYEKRYSCILEHAKPGAPPPPAFAPPGSAEARAPASVGAFPSSAPGLPEPPSLVGGVPSLPASQLGRNVRPVRAPGVDFDNEPVLSPIGLDAFPEAPSLGPGPSMLRVPSTKPPTAPPRREPTAEYATETAKKPAWEPTPEPAPLLSAPVVGTAVAAGAGLAAGAGVAASKLKSAAPTQPDAPDAPLMSVPAAAPTLEATAPSTPELNSRGTDSPLRSRAAAAASKLDSPAATTPELAGGTSLASLRSQAEAGVPRAPTFPELDAASSSFSSRSRVDAAPPTVAGVPRAPTFPELGSASSSFSSRSRVDAAAPKQDTTPELGSVSAASPVRSRAGAVAPVRAPTFPELDSLRSTPKLDAAATPTPELDSRAAASPLRTAPVVSPAVPKLASGPSTPNSSSLRIRSRGELARSDSAKRVTSLDSEMAVLSSPKLSGEVQRRAGMLEQRASLASLEDEMQRKGSPRSPLAGSAGKALDAADAEMRRSERKLHVAKEGARAMDDEGSSEFLQKVHEMRQRESPVRMPTQTAAEESHEFLRKAQENWKPASVAAAAAAVPAVAAVVPKTAAEDSSEFLQKSEAMRNVERTEKMPAEPQKTRAQLLAEEEERKAAAARAAEQARIDAKAAAEQARLDAEAAVKAAAEQKRLVALEAERRAEEARLAAEAAERQRVADEEAARVAAKLAMERARELVVNGRSAPAVAVPELKGPRLQRAAVDKSFAMARGINEKQGLIEKLEEELVEAKHRLSNARVAVSPAFNVVYELDEEQGVPLPQVALMGVVAVALLTLFV